MRLGPVGPLLQQVGDPLPVAEQVVAVQLQQRVEVEEHPRPEDRQHHQGQVVRPGPRAASAARRRRPAPRGTGRSSRRPG